MSPSSSNSLSISAWKGEVLQMVRSTRRPQYCSCGLLPRRQRLYRPFRLCRIELIREWIVVQQLIFALCEINPALPEIIKPTPQRPKSFHKTVKAFGIEICLGDFKPKSAKKHASIVTFLFSTRSLALAISDSAAPNDPPMANCCYRLKRDGNFARFSTNKPFFTAPHDGIRLDQEKR